MLTVTHIPHERPRGKTNSERGKAFRARRKQYESDLLSKLGFLRREVQDLQTLREIRQECSVTRSRQSTDGAVARLVREYFELFGHGMRSEHLMPSGKRSRSLPIDQLPHMAKQRDFLYAAMDPALKFGDMGGIPALMDQWQRYTNYHASFRAEILHLTVSGTEELPIVTVNVRLIVRLSRDTFRHIFPHVVHDHELVDKLIGREVVYVGTNHFHFTGDGRIAVYDSDVGFVDAFLNAGASLEDVAKLMQQALIVDQFALGEVDRVVEVSSSTSTAECEPIDNATKKKKKSLSALDMEYILS